MERETNQIKQLLVLTVQTIEKSSVETCMYTVKETVVMGKER